MSRGRFRISRTALAALVLGATLIAPAQAGAASVWKAGDAITVTSGDESSDLSVAREGSHIVVDNYSGSVSPAAGCAKAKGKKAKCPIDDADRLVAVLGDGADTLDTSSSFLAVSAWGGDGDDTLLVGNGFDDYVSCGDGVDGGVADAGDSLASDCESMLERPIGTPPALAPEPAAPPVDGVASDEPAGTGQDTAAGGDGAGEDPEPEPESPVAIETPATVQLTAAGALPVGIDCTADAGRCTGTIEVVELGGALKARPVVESARRRKTRKATVLGRAKFNVAAGKSTQVTVRLSRRGRQRIIRKKKRRTRAKIVVSMRAPDGTVTTTEKNVSIAAPRERRTSARRGSRKSSSAQSRGR